jgi:hypothetical protein
MLHKFYGRHQYRHYVVCEPVCMIFRTISVLTGIAFQFCSTNRCYVAKDNLDAALSSFQASGGAGEVEVNWKVYFMCVCVCVCVFVCV